ncbi:MAG: response regulator transcription factor [Saprospiraceae bacterium]|nr:response regulator transcription factor [Saprospiraceae bacterium]MCB9319652.1 response regulator transcription factor [Lewinellaceae bacterium]
MKAIIVDDEPKAIELLSNYLRMWGGIELVSTFRNSLKALEFLQEHPVDLILLDINMPHLSGMDLARMIPAHTRIIFTTAYSEFAVESYRLDAVDYLLKPITLERFIRAINKLGFHRESGPDANIQLIKSGNRTYQIPSDKIAFLEKEGNYMTYHTDQEKILARQSISEALEQLPDHFIQIHKSYIVNLHRVVYWSKEEVKIQDVILPVSTTYRAALESHFHKEL